MTSMAFDNNTVTEIMSLIDEHKDNIQEGEYIKICNAMKYLHEQSIKSKQQKYSDTIPIDPDIYMRTLINNIYKKVRELTTSKQQLETFIELNEPITTYKGRLSLQDKHNVLMKFIEFDDEDVKPKKKDVYIIQKRIIEHNLISINELNELYNKEKELRINKLREDAIRKIEDTQRRIIKINDKITSKINMIEQLESLISY